MKIVVLGTAVLDIYASPIEQKCFEGETTVIDKIGITPGGDAMNQAITLAKFNADVALIARLGKDDMGDIVMSKLAASGVDVSSVVMSPSSVTTTAIALIRKNGQRNIVNIKGNNYDFCAEDVDLEKIKNAGILSIGSIYGLPKLEKDGGLMAALKTAKEAGTITLADMGSDKFNQGIAGVKEFLPYIDYFAPSIAEAKFLTNEDSIEKMAASLEKAGAKTIIIKNGEKGVYYYKNGRGEHISSYKVNAVDTTGAGDTFCASFLFAKSKGKEDKEAIKFACASAAISTQYFGATGAPLNEETVLKFMEENAEK